MAPHAIIEKLNSELTKPIESERQVVYILVEIRKLLKMNRTVDMDALNFHCDWAVHGELSWAPAQKVVEAFNERAEMWKQVADPTEPVGDWNTSIEKLNNIAELTRFREQFQEFCRANDIVGHLVDDEMEWSRFLRYYGAVIEDCPLTCNAKHVRLVKRVVIKVGKAPEFRARVTNEDVILLNWCIGPEGDEIVAHQLALRFPRA